MSYALPELSKQAKVHERSRMGFENASYEQSATQYATSSIQNQSRMRPRLIIEPGTEQDVQAVLRYAKERKIQVAVRSGGHAYHGGSSSGGDNIQLDMGNGSLGKLWKFDDAVQELTIGTGWTLGAVKKNLQSNYKGYKTKGCFFAHGNCAGVGVGGHMHTGGYSMQSRSFGLFIDYVQRFRIVTASDGEIRDIHKPDPAHPNADNDDLWWAVLGGGSGSFGVTTQLTLRCLHDRDFPESRAYMQSYIWTRKNGKGLITALLDHMAKISDEDALPADFCYHVSLASAAPKYFTLRNIMWDSFATIGALVEQTLEKHIRRSPSHTVVYLCTRALRFYRSIFGSSNGRNPLFEASMVPLIIVHASWNNLSGKRHDYDASVVSFFDELDHVARPFLPKGLLGRVIQNSTKILSPKKHQPITETIDTFTFKGEREYDLPYIKRNWAGYAEDLAQRRFGTEAAKLFDNFTHSKFTSETQPWHGSVVVCAWGYLGGTHSSVTTMAAHTQSCMPHRNSRISWMTDYFYDPDQAGARTYLVEWILDYDTRVVGSPKAFFCERDARCMFAPFDTKFVDDDFVPPDLHKLHEHFYDKPADYKRVQSIKKRFDPDGVFCSSPFLYG